MSNFYQTNKLSYKEAQTRLNNHLSGLRIVTIQNSSSDTKQLFISIYSKKHEANYHLSIGTDTWSWKNAKGREISVFKNEFIDEQYHMLAVADELVTLVDTTLIIKNLEVSEESKVLKIYFDDGSILEAQEDLTSEDTFFYQLILDENKTYQNYNLVTKGTSWLEEITNGEEHGPYKVAIFDLDYFRTEHRNFTTHAIKQARERKSPVSFIQAKVLYEVLSTELSNKSILLFSPWGIRRSSTDRIRLETVPLEELISLSKNECEKNKFSIEEAKDILKSMIDPLKGWMKSEKDVEEVVRQEYCNQGLIRALKWYENTF